MSVQVAADPFTEVLLNFYEETASLYDGWAGGVNRKAAIRLTDLAAVQSHEVVVDAGCGTGLVSRILPVDRTMGGRALGVDISPAMLDVAEANRPHGAAVTFTQGTVEDLVLPDKSVDVVILGLVLAYTADPEAGLQEAHRVLKPGGRIAVSGQQRSLMTEVDEVFFAELLDIGSTFSVPRRREEHAMLGEPWMLQGLLEEAGFTDVRTSNLLVGNHTRDARSFIELMQLEGPWPHAVIRLMGPGARSRLEKRLTGSVRFSREDGRFIYHRPFSFAVGHRV
ncbi:MAG: methyltransferase domain-containing protein [Candidatus Dormibacteraeota bacterium]|nr:methyltransferase domain-containing protein [Candidatus Dormibacteraeota bacterium]